MMMNMIRRAAVICTVSVVLLSVSACSKLDVVGANSKTSFGEVLAVLDDNIISDPFSGAFALIAPDRTAGFFWFSDFSRSGNYDVALMFDAAPFFMAGLDPEKLPAGITLDDDGGGIVVWAKLGQEPSRLKEEPTALSAFGQIVDMKRSVIGYHAAADHYGVTIGDGNLFEWAKDMNVNDKDIVFVLNPGPFIAAGVNPNAVPGWSFAKVPVDVDGKPVEVDKLLKPFDLK
jgi:hypothetical protein